MKTIDLAQALIRRPSQTPDDAGCQMLIADRLTAHGFAVEHMRFGAVDNLWAVGGRVTAATGSVSGTGAGPRGGVGADAGTTPAESIRMPRLVFAGHTDVVPPGQTDEWAFDPFGAEIRDGMLLGRGAADMKGSLAAMVAASIRFADTHPEHAGDIGLLLTSDEEGAADDGTLKVMETLAGRGPLFEYCVVGEPSSSKRLGDTVRVGRRGSLSGIMTISGVQGHVAYPLAAENPMHAFGRFVAAMTEAPIDHGNAYFPPTTFQMVHVHSDAGAVNVVPGVLDCRFNFRFSTEWTFETLSAWVEDRVEALGIDCKLRWRRAGVPFLTERGALTDAVTRAVREETGLETNLSTDGGTSDGRFIAPYGIGVVELGPINATIHKVDEQVRADDLDALERMYFRIAELLLT